MNSAVPKTMLKPTATFRATETLELTEEARRMLKSRFGERIAIRVMVMILKAIAENAFTPTMKRMATEGVIVGEFVMERWRVLNPKNDVPTEENPDA